jgi:tellurite resistance protein TerC
MGRVPVWLWWGGAAVLVGLIAVDLIWHARHEIRQRTAIIWTGIYVGAGLLFAALLYLTAGRQPAEEYLAAYLIEKALSLDNLFVFMLIFRGLRLDRAAQHKVLTWGIFGALGFRALFVVLGIAALERWYWLTWVFGAALLWAAIRAIREDPHAREEPAYVRFMERHLRLPKPILALIAVELTDVSFAIDSVPAALAVTRDRLIVYAANAFAIVGLRALYVVIERLLARLEYLHYGLAAVLAFAAVKIVAGDRLPISPLLSVGVIAFFILSSVVASWLARRVRHEPADRAAR